LYGWLEIPHTRIPQVTKVTVVAKGTHGNQGSLGLLFQLLSRAETHVGLYIKYPLLLFDFNQNQNASTFLVNYPTSNFMKIRSAVLGLLHADKQTDIYMAKLTGALLQLLAAKAPTIA
jgi:hypothetical protein